MGKEITRIDSPDEMAVQAAAALPDKLAIVKMENEAIMAMATARPLDYRVVLADLKAQLEVSPRFAEEAIYEKPVGKDDSGQMKYARGLSIFAAEAVASSMGFSRTRRAVSFIAGQPDVVEICSTFTNFRNGTINEIVKVVSRKYKARGGAIAYHPEDRFFDIVVTAAQSKATREAILRAMPPAIRLELERMVEETLATFLDPATIKKLLDYFGTLKVSPAQVEGLIGKRADAFNQQDRSRLLGIVNALKQGETTAEEVFGTAAEATTEAKTTSLRDKLARTPQAPAEPEQPEGDEHKHDAQRSGQRVVGAQVAHPAGQRGEGLAHLRFSGGGAISTVCPRIVMLTP